MCGIIGIHGNQENEWAERMNRVQFHRGPDDGGIFRDPQESLAIGMRRLAIVDLTTGSQPMTTQDGRFTIVFNGEIFNAPELRRELEAAGVSFVTDHSDTEVVLQLYGRVGSAVTLRLNGMFAFAIYDKSAQTLFLARDHAGIKPLYYAETDGRFAFASELKALLSLPFLKREINIQSLFHYMSLMYVPGEETIFEGVRRLPAGSSLTYSLQDGRMKFERWWSPNFEEQEQRSLSEWTERVRDSLEGAVKRWLMADVSIGCSLSGGLDSSAVVGFAAQSGLKMKTYSLGFEGPGESSWNELPRARLIARRFHTDHHELILNAETLLDDLVSMVWHLDEPYAGGLPSWKVFEFMGRDVKVGLTGSGGDEMFGNYGKWKGLGGGGFFEKSREVAREEFEKNFFEKFYYFPDGEKREMLFHSHDLKNTSDVLYTYFEKARAGSVRDRLTGVDLATQLPEEFLMMTDRFSMAHSLEARTPFLDREFMELMFRIPVAQRTKTWDLKYLLRRALSSLLPLRILYARKKGFVIPLKLWLRGPLRPLVSRMLSPERLRHQGIFSEDFYVRYARPHIEGRADFTNKVWAALMFQLWHHVFIEQKAVDKPSYSWKDIAS